MNSRNADPPEPEFETIRPVAVDLRPSGTQTSTEAGKTSHFSAWVVVLALMILTALVVLVLPRLIKEPAPAVVETTVSSPKPMASVENPAATVSPWELAQQARARDAAKNALDAILEAQFALQEMQVEQWAKTEFDAALNLAKKGDEAYRAQEFDQARERYEQAGNQLTNLMSSTPEVYRRQIDAGLAALADADAASAQSAFATALLIRPDDEAALTGMHRAEVLDEVNRETVAAESALRAGELNDAVAGFRRALELDAQHVPARDGLNEAESALANRQYGKAMSDGYAALTAGNFDLARQQFNQAAKLLPGSPETREALAQVEAAIAKRKIDRLLTEGQTAAGAEDWRLASDKYTAALAIEPGLVEAAAALKQAQTRERLDQVLQAALDKPLELVDEQRYQTALSVLRKANELAEKGPRLRDQLRRLAVTLRDARTPIPVSFISDNATEVSILRVKRLGRFEAMRLELNPGAYVVHGRREGFRDVRQEFVLQPGDRSPTIDVRCTEPV